MRHLKSGIGLASLLMVTACASCSGGGSGGASAAPPAPVGATPTPTPTPTPTALTGAEHYADMKAKLGINAMKPGRNSDGDAANGANYDESKANPYPDLPDPLIDNAGNPVDTPQAWENTRRAELIEAFEQDVYGKVPSTAPDIFWQVTESENGVLQGEQVLIRKLVGRPNAEVEGIDLEIRMLVVTPAIAGEKAPVLVMLGPGDETPPAEVDSHGDLPRQHLLIERGWGYAMLNTDTIQPDTPDGLSSGVIGYSKQGGYRDPDDWGTLRAWAWGASQALSFLETDSEVDPGQIGVEGVSRYGKAALLAMAFDERFDVGLIASSGKGGTTLLRRNFGEAVSNLTSSGFHHWMAGNFLKYGSADPGAPDAGDLPVDSHELLALIAPRPVFISYGIPEAGDAEWLDHLGTFKAILAANPVYQLLGVPGLLPMPADTSTLPPVNESLLDGRLGWRQHDGGHTDRPNISRFTAWAAEQ